MGLQWWDVKHFKTEAFGLLCCAPKPALMAGGWGKHHWFFLHDSALSKSGFNDEKSRIGWMAGHGRLRIDGSNAGRKRFFPD